MRPILMILLVFGWTSLGNSFSQYSIQGIGEPVYGETAAEMGQGVLGIATTHAVSLSQTNPAFLGEHQLTTFSATLLAAGWNINDGASSAYYRSATLPQLQLVVPVFLKTKVAFGLTERTHVEFKTTATQPFNDTDLTRTIDINGGLHALRLGLGHQFFNRAAVGFYGDLLFGSIEEEWETTFEDGTYSPTIDKPTTHFKGVDFTYGIHLRPHARISLGLIWRPSRDVDAKTYSYVGFQDNAVDTLKQQLTLPATFGAGFSFSLPEEINLTADFVRTDWEDLALDGVPFANTKNLTRYGVGLEFLADRDADEWYQAMPFRVGYHSESWYITDDRERVINGYYWSLGTRINLWRQRGELDLGFTYGMRGHNMPSSMQESVYQLSVTAFGFEKWF